MPAYCHIRLELDKTLAIPPGLATCRIQRRQGSLMFICKLLNHDSFLSGLEDESTHA
ncbi:hypothetical protein GGE32_006178 [Rhizobium leguminosarum]|nr:hypothetical protein [Rhizobium leguminosarum]MBB4357922.1 hypothetical protein [Rhizobium leguminosarum]MBB4552198.1 hypothetical protein [Rhizobium leguminosarum]MBB4564942.1 hypothetical protein [Rhizobium leguminosarum]